MQTLPTKHFVDGTGRYLGAFAGIQHDDIISITDEGIAVTTPGRIDYPQPPAGAIEVALPPAHGLDVWNGTSWDAHVPPPVDLDAEIAKRDPLIQALVELVPGGIEAVKTRVEEMATRGKLTGRKSLKKP